jgi:integrase
MTPRTVVCRLPSRRRGRGQRSFPQAPASAAPPPSGPRGRVPRVSRLLALAHRLDELVRTGVVADYATLAQLAHVSRARISQILNLLLLAPDIQEAVLFLPRTERGRDPIHLRQLQPLAAVLDWQQQRRLWQELRRNQTPRTPSTDQGC